MPPLVADGTRKPKSRAATEASSPLAPAAVFQAAREIAQAACPLETAAQVLQAAPVAERTFAPETTSPAARPLPVPNTWTSILLMAA